MKEASGVIDAYISTVHTTWAELRVTAPSAATPGIVLDNGERLLLSPAIDDGQRAWYRHRFENLPPDSAHVAVLHDGDMRTEVQFRTLKQPPGDCRVRFGVVSDSHIQPMAAITRSSSGTRRLYDRSRELAARYLNRLAEQDVDFVVLPGDTLDPCDDETVPFLQELMNSVDVPCHLMIGNHEVYGRYNEDDFNAAFGIPVGGFRCFVHNDIAFVLLSTPHQGSLSPRSGQFRWLKTKLDLHATRRETFVFSHLSAVLHPCVQGWKNDGMQQLFDADELLELLSRYPRLRAFIAGHKNVPSVVERDGVVHMLCPQLIQAPCGYSVFEIHDDGFVHNVYEIDEQHWQQISRDAFGSDFPERHGIESHRNFFHKFEGEKKIGGPNSGPPDR